MAYIKPAEGRKVRRPPPSLQLLPDEGAEVNLAEAGYYWQRRLRDGDVVLAEAPKPTVEETAAPAASAPAEEHPAEPPAEHAAS